MPLTFPNIVYTSGDFTIATAVGLPRFSPPLTGVNADYRLDQDFQINLNSFAALALNTAHPDFPDYFLVMESELSDLGGGQVKWTRTYSQVPATYTEMGGNYAYNYIGLAGAYPSAGIPPSTPQIVLSGRLRFTLTVPVQITREFFLVGTGGSYATAEAIPYITDQKYLYNNNIYYPQDYLFDSVTVGMTTYAGTTPSKTDYLALIVTDAGTQTSFSIAVETSTISRWMGNIYMRETRRVKAL